ncbi:biotin--[acetyl-CoA-carboxylase] ligase [Actinomycetospora endophytica]|uniref:biotin--[biotin carboxyl-carrier protein] ligase n=1 Tax=Actinomycetospora endophytica TaxID=2291215 RepID=A0ABS8PGL4_9PSEU|nr:biotin--[acetyl-CoA-carboxylase] ligase [Actinomycetospora endophytica]MCD2197414.1 biotin--[acetyl-CoA-carboxylase] ligase [Actinomycetospora endophytica]
MLPGIQEAAAWAALRETAVAPRGAWARVDVVDRTGSTNADLVVAAADGAPDRTVLVAHRQDAGRGRRERVWESAPSEGLTFSVLLRPSEVPVAQWGWAPLIAGLALVVAMEDYRPAAGDAPVTAALKWPNDLLLGPDLRKGAGILSEVVDGGASSQPPQALVVGIGINVSTPQAELPEGGTSLLAQSVTRSRPDVLGDVLATYASLDADWRAARGDAARAGLLAGYRRRCATLGATVRVSLPGDRVLEGVAEDVDDDGRLVVRGHDGSLTTVSAGDVVHVRTVGS